MSYPRKARKTYIAPSWYTLTLRRNPANKMMFAFCSMSDWHRIRRMVWDAMAYWKQGEQLASRESLTTYGRY